MSRIIIQEDEDKDKIVSTQEDPEEQERQEEQEAIKVRPGDAFEYKERTRETIKPDLPFSALIPEEYYEQREQEERAKNERLRKKEVGRMKMSALADAFRLIGDGIAVNKGAHEKKWEPNQQHQRALKALEKLDVDEAAALEKLRDLRLRQKEADRNFNYRAGRDAIGDQERMMATNEANQKYLDALARQDEREEYNRERQKKLDEQGAADRAADRSLRREQIEVSRQRANNSSRSQTPEYNEVQATVGSDSYVFDIERANDREAISIMLKDFLDNVSNKELMEKWQAQNSPEWTALRDMLNPNKKWTRYGVSALMPHIFNPEIADSYQIRFINRPQQQAQEAPTTQQPQEPAPQAPAPSPGQWSEPSYGTWRGRRQAVSAPQPNPAQQVIQSIEEEKARKEAPPAQEAPTVQQPPAPVQVQPQEPQQNRPQYEDVANYSGRDEKRALDDLIQHKEWATLSEEDRIRKAFAHISSSLGYEDGRYHGLVSVGDIRSVAENLGEYYRFNDPQAAAIIEVAAQRKGVSAQEFLEAVVNHVVKNNIHPNELIYNLIGDE